MMRLDKFISSTQGLSRSEAREAIKSGKVLVNKECVKKNDMQVNELLDHVNYQGREIAYQHFYYYMLHKPAGVITSTEKGKEKTVMDLLKDVMIKDLFPVGRLDKDTEGLLLITNDGMLSHNLLSPKKHVEKKYLVECEHVLTDEDCRLLEGKLDIGEGEYSNGSKVEKMEGNRIFLTIKEGKFHQVKRMLEAVDNHVLYLKRLRMGNLELDESLCLGQYRELTEEELHKLLKKI